MSDLYLKQMLLGPMENFVYLVGSRSTGECFAVDPAWDIEAIKKQADQDGMRLTGALVTHFHPDHCGGHLWGHDIPGVAELGLPVYANKQEVEGLRKITGLGPTDVKGKESGDTIAIGHLSVKLIHTPGHTPGSQCFLVDDHLVAGDTLFISGCGRVDLPGGNPDALYDSLVNKLAKLPAHTVLFPGHNYGGKSATLETVKSTNPYMQIDTLARWRQIMGGPGS